MVKPAYKVYIVTGFVLSGWFYFIPGRIKLPDPAIKRWEAVRIPTKDLKLLYLGLEFWSRVKSIFKRTK